MQNITVENYDAPPPGWNRFVEEHPGGKIYHLVEWNRMVSETFGHPVTYIVVKNNEKIAGILPLTEFRSLLFGHFAVSQPFINYGGPLLEAPELAEPLNAHLAAIRVEKKYDYIELRFDSVRETALRTKEHKVTFFLDLPSNEEELWNSFKSKLRSQIRRPMKEEMTARTGGVDLLPDFHDVFAKKMRELGTPVLPRKFFKNILETFPQNAFIVTVYSKEGTAVAVSFLIKYKDVFEIPWAASLKDFDRFSPNMLLYWESLKLGIEKGCNVFDFGRCTPEGGTYKFKRQWNGREHPLSWAYVLPNSDELPELNPHNDKFSLAIKIWSKLPLSVTKILGPQIIKNIP